MLINKRPNISCIAEFQLHLNKISLTREYTVKYLEIFLDENLKWCNQVQHHSLQLARYSGLFYKICSFLSSHTRRMLYHTLIDTKSQYVVLVCGTTSRTYFSELMGQLNNIFALSSVNTRHLAKDVFKPSFNKNIGKETILYRGGSLWGEIDRNIKKLIGLSLKCNTKKFTKKKCKKARSHETYRVVQKWVDSKNLT